MFSFLSCLHPTTDTQGSLLYCLSVRLSVTVLCVGLLRQATDSVACIGAQLRFSPLFHTALFLFFLFFVDVCLFVFWWLLHICLIDVPVPLSIKLLFLCISSFLPTLLRSYHYCFCVSFTFTFSHNISYIILMYILCFHFLLSSFLLASMYCHCLSKTFFFYSIQA